MSSPCYSLRPNVLVEPLILKWYAWIHLVSPLNAGCNIRKRYLPIMDSFVESPELHEEALKNPKMLGGPFINLPKYFADEVRQLSANIKNSAHEVINLSKDYEHFNNLLQHSRGQSLTPLYQQLPTSLKGFVELVYDENNHPRIKFIEPLLYRKYNLAHHQSLEFSIIDSDDRNFIMSTPRISSDSKWNWAIPFSDERASKIFASTQYPLLKSEILELTDNFTGRLDYFDKFFEKSAPLSESDNTLKANTKIRIRYFGHACVLLETVGVNIMVDPIISCKYNSSLERLTYEDLPDTLDYVLITHSHADHIVIESLLKIKHKIKNLVLPKARRGSILDPSMYLLAKELGIHANIIRLDDLESIELQEGKLLSIPFLGEHGDLDIQSKTAYLVQLYDKSFLFSADSDNLSSELYAHIFNGMPTIDMLFLGMECKGAPINWLYGPLFSQPITQEVNMSRRLSGSNSQRGFEMVKQLNVKHVCLYAMGLEPWLSHIMALAYTHDSMQLKEVHQFTDLCKTINIQVEKPFAKQEWSY